MKVMAINGSPRRDGASATVAREIASAFAGSGHEVKEYHLNGLSIHGCQECFSCRIEKTDLCNLKDGLSEILEQAKIAEVLVVSTPVFYADISAQLKCFIDRTWSYFGRTGVSAEHLPKGRSLVFIMSYGYADPAVYDGVYEKYSRYFRMFGFDRCYMIKAYGAQYNSPEIVNRQEVERLVREIPMKIMGSKPGGR
jgi:NAD(P)H-dependent FMN reductase